MKRIFICVSTVLVALAGTSCGSLQLATPGAAPKVIESTRSATIRTANVLTAPLFADLQTEQTKKSGVAKGKKTAVAMDELKRVAVLDVLTKSGGDVLIEPSYLVEDDGYNNLTVTVTGYVAKYINFRQGTDGLYPVYILHPGESDVRKPAPEATEQPAGAAAGATPQAAPQRKGALGIGIGPL
jgi:hypothetical protein